MSKKTPKKHGAPEAKEQAPTDASAPAATPPAAGADGEPVAVASPLEERMHELERELDAARAEAAAASDRSLRTLAEFDNYRRRTERDRDEATIRGRADVLRELLEVADNFDRALAHAGDDVPAAFVEGMRLVARGVHDLLDRKGVARIEAEGKRFDPEVHEALTVMPVDGAEPDTIVQVVQAGYRLGDRVLRPAKVIVAAPPSRAEVREDVQAADRGEEA